MSDEHADNLRAVEALLFAAEGPCDEDRLAAVLEVPQDTIQGLVEELCERLEGSGLQVVRLAGGYQMATRPRYAEYVQRLREPEAQRLSPQALETLAIIAYRQPITRPEIDQVRGVDSSGVVNSLLEKSLIAITGRKRAPGRPFLLSTTPHFLSTFGLNDLTELPALPEAEQGLAARLPELVSADADQDSGAEEAQAPSAADEEH